MKTKIDAETRKLMNEKLSQLIPDYGEKNAIKLALKKPMDALNKEIKQIMSQLEINDFEVNNFTAKYEVRTSKTLNLDKVLALLISKKATYEKCKELGIIKTKEYVDEDALESAWYKGELSKKLILELEKCEDIKETEYLTVSKTKGK